jgi:GDP-L-fucose synthase
MESPKTTILVTGGGGLVGRALQWAMDHSEYPQFRAKPQEKWVFLTSADGDLRQVRYQSVSLTIKQKSLELTGLDYRDFASTKAIFERWRPNIVVHLAARVGGVFANMAYQADFLVDNISINQNVLKLCHEFKVSFCSSGSHSCSCGY